MVLRTATTEFLRPVMYEDSVVVNVWVSHIGHTSFVLQHELLQYGEICVTVEAVVVLFDVEKQASKPIPDPLRAVLETVSASL